MGWTIKKHKVNSNPMELQMVIKLKEIAKISTSKTAKSFINEFEKEMLTIKRTNIFSAEYAYKMIPLTSERVEVWKMKVNGDFNYKMFTLDYDGKIYNPFNF